MGIFETVFTIISMIVIAVYIIAGIMTDDDIKGIRYIVMAVLLISLLSHTII